MSPKLIINHNISSELSKEDLLRKKVDELLEMNEKMKKELEELRSRILVCVKK